MPTFWDGIDIEFGLLTMVGLVIGTSLEASVPNRAQPSPPVGVTIIKVEMEFSLS